MGEDKVLTQIEKLIDIIQTDTPNSEAMKNFVKIPSREDILNLHLAFIKALLLIDKK
jgi:hypothetical protein